MWEERYESDTRSGLNLSKPRTELLIMSCHSEYTAGPPDSALFGFVG